MLSDNGRFNKKSRNLIEAGGFFLACLSVCFVILNSLYNYYIHKRMDGAASAGETVGSSLVEYINFGIYCSDVMDIMFKDSKPDMEKIGRIVEKFNEISDETIKLMIVCRGRNVKYTFPEEEPPEYYEDFFKKGGLLFNEAEYAEQNKHTIISNTFRLLSGEDVFAMLHPVSGKPQPDRKDSDIPSNYVVSVYDADELMQVSGADGLKEQGYFYRIYKTNPATNITETLSSFGDQHITSPVKVDIDMPNGEIWHLILSLNGGWVTRAEKAGGILLALMISFLSSLAFYLILSIKSREKELKVMSYSDSLTNLKNTRAYTDSLERLKDEEDHYGIIYIDVNDFKIINDTYGHKTGDDVLHIAAGRIGNTIRKSDELFRIGGDEFALIIHGDHNGEFYEEIIKRMKESMSRKISIREKSLFVTISCGYARFPEDGLNYEAVTVAADREMYRDKAEMKGENGSGSRS